MGPISNQETTEPSFLWVFILMKDSKLLQVQASRRILSFWHTRFIFVRNNLILRVSAVKVVILFQKIELHILIYKQIYIYGTFTSSRRLSSKVWKTNIDQTLNRLGSPGQDFPSMGLGASCPLPYDKEGVPRQTHCGPHP